jgi:hypothetical protein
MTNQIEVGTPLIASIAMSERKLSILRLSWFVAEQRDYLFSQPKLQLSITICSIEMCSIEMCSIEMCSIEMCSIEICSIEMCSHHFSVFGRRMSGRGRFSRPAET